MITATMTPGDDDYPWDIDNKC